MKRDIPIHPAAEIFPLMDDESYQRLKADIEANGLQEPVMLWRQQLVDGRHRYRACEELGIHHNPAELDDDDDPLAFILSANLHRRHLTTSQRAMVGAEVEELFAAAAKERQREAGGNKVSEQAKEALPVNLPEAVKGEAREQAAKMVRVSPRSISDAKAIKKANPKLADDVRKGKVTVHAAKKKVAPKAKPKPALPPPVVLPMARPKIDASMSLEDKLLCLLSDEWIERTELASEFRGHVPKEKALEVANLEGEGKWIVFKATLAALQEQGKIERRVVGDDDEFRLRQNVPVPEAHVTVQDQPVPAVEQVAITTAAEPNDDDRVAMLGDQLCAAVGAIQKAWPASRLDALSVILECLAEEVPHSDVDAEPPLLKRQRKKPTWKRRTFHAKQLMSVDDKLYLLQKQVDRPKEEQDASAIYVLTHQARNALLNLLRAKEKAVVA